MVPVEGSPRENKLVQNALIGQQDPLFVYKKHDYIATSVEARGRDSYNTGDRMSTLMLYLTEVTAGGYTAFPRLGVAVRSDRKIQFHLECCAMFLFPRQAGEGRGGVVAQPARGRLERHGDAARRLPRAARPQARG